MATVANAHASATFPSSVTRYGVQFISGGRIFAGALSWASPKLASRVFLLGRADPDGRTGLLARLFGVRDVALGLALQHPSADVRMAALRAGVAIDTADVLASFLAVRAGAPKSTLTGVASGAAAFVGLALVALAQERRS